MLQRSCDQCLQTKAARYFKRLPGGKGYYTTCRDCTGDEVRYKICCVCEESKRLVLGFTELVGYTDGKPAVFSDDCRVCRRKEKDMKRAMKRREHD